jgi:hypothetical protein
MRRRLVRVALAPAFALIIAACGSAASEPVASPTTVEPTTTLETIPPPPPPTWPLTGLPMADGTTSAHPAVAVKIDNSADAWPQVGINQADLVYEVWVEGITRFATIFHSTPGDPVGPVRSARSTDINLVGNLGKPLLAWSGGNPGVTGQVKEAEAWGTLVDASHSVAEPHYWRQAGRTAPHNLFTNVSSLITAVPGGGSPAPVAAFRSDGEPLHPGALPAAGVQVDFGLGSVVEYRWDPARSCWARFQEGPFVDEAGEQVCPANVVVMHTQYGPSVADARSPEAYSVGDGEMMLLSDGQAILGRWARPEAGAAWSFVAFDGAPLALTPGRTWFALPRAGSPVTLL